MHMKKVRWGNFITLLHWPYYIKAKGSTVRDSQIYSPGVLQEFIVIIYLPGKITFSLSHPSLRWECHSSAFQAPPTNKKQKSSAENIVNIKIFDCNALQIKKVAWSRCFWWYVHHRILLRIWLWGKCHLIVIFSRSFEK